MTDLERPVLRGCTMANALLAITYARAGQMEEYAYFMRELQRRPEPSEPRLPPADFDAQLLAAVSAHEEEEA